MYQLVNVDLRRRLALMTPGGSYNWLDEVVSRVRGPSAKSRSVVSCANTEHERLTDGY